MPDGERKTVNVSGGLLANRGPYGLSPLEVTPPGYPVSGLREVVQLGEENAVMTDGSNARGQLYQTTHDHSLIFRPGDSLKK